MTLEKPIASLTLSKLAAEVEEKRPEPLRIHLSGSKSVVFNYPLTYKRSERKEFLDMIRRATENFDEQELMERMLSPEDLAKYDAENLDDDVHMAVIEALGKHFKFGERLENEGKAGASDLL